MEEDEEYIIEEEEKKNQIFEYLNHYGSLYQDDKIFNHCTDLGEKNLQYKPEKLILWFGEKNNENILAGAEITYRNIIDGKEIDRSLTSIRAEVERRGRLFAEAFEGQDKDPHIDDYITLWKAGKVSTPLPHLIIIVDEFQELKKQFPDFMEALNTIAATGRTYGIHLILATQKPKGLVDPKVESNSRFRICLKVQSEEDSREVIKTPLAAEIREAGRAYLMVGNNEVFELFQSAYSGAPEDLELLSQQSEFCI